MCLTPSSCHASEKLRCRLFSLFQDPDKDQLTKLTTRRESSYSLNQLCCLHPLSCLCLLIWLAQLSFEDVSGSTRDLCIAAMRCSQGHSSELICLIWFCQRSPECKCSPASLWIQYPSSFNPFILHLLSLEFYHLLNPLLTMVCYLLAVHFK
jgi:hypothetical protein